MELAEYLVILGGSAIALIVFFHSWYYFKEDKISRKFYAIAKISFGLLVSGMLVFFLLVKTNFMEFFLNVTADKHNFFLVFSGVWMLAGAFFAMIYFCFFWKRGSKVK